MVYPRIKDLREDLDLSQEDVANILHCTHKRHIVIMKMEKEIFQHQSLLL